MKQHPKLLPLAACMSLAFSAQAEEVAYSHQLLRSILPPGQNVDTSFFEKGLDLSPGAYELDIVVNGVSYPKRKVVLREFEGRLEPAFTLKDLYTLPFKEEALAKLADVNPDTPIHPLSRYFESVACKVDAASQTLEISIPQLFLAERNIFDIAPQALWDYGEPGAVLNYNLSGSHFEDRQNGRMSSLYGTLNAQVNMGPWRLHSSGSFHVNRDVFAGETFSDHQWDLWNTYLQRDVNAVKGTLQIGEINTSGEIFDSVSMRGVRLSTNEMMIPSADRQYSPVIEGVANSNAQILIRQNGRVVYTTNVSAGPFRLDKLPTFSQDGDLEVVIREADGSERVMLVPYSSIPMMLKEGQLRYDLNVGQYYRHNLSPGVERKFFTQGSLSYGLPHDVTLYGGAILADKYFSAAFGAGLSLGLYGAVAVDATQSKAVRDPANGIEDDLNGTAWRIRYEKTMLSTGTTINLANYHYLTGHYRTFSEIAEYGSRFYVPVDNAGMKSKWQLSLSQSVGDYGSISGNVTYTTYKGGEQDTKNINLGYSTSIKGVGVYLNYGRNYEERANRGWESSHSVMLNLNIPLSLFFSGSSSSTLRRTDVQYQGSMFKTAQGDKTYQQRALVNGYTEDSTWNWTLSQTMGREETRESAVRVGYNGHALGADLGYTYSHYGHSFQGGINGGLVLHSGGITPTRYAYDSIALIEVPDVKGVRLGNAFDTTTNSSGYAALTYLNNYTRNEISIDPSTLPDGALLLENTNRVVYPTSGAIVKVKYPVRFGRQALFHLYNNGTPLPFGTEIKLLGEDGQVDPHVQGLVGESGRVFLTALPAKGRMQAVLADATTVEFNYKLSDEPQSETNGNLNVERLNLDAASPGAARKVEIEFARGIESREEAASDHDALPAELIRSYGQGRFCFLLKDSSGQPLPAGTIVVSKDGGREVVGSIDPAGRLFMSNIPSHGHLYTGNQAYVY